MLSHANTIQGGETLAQQTDSRDQPRAGPGLVQEATVPCTGRFLSEPVFSFCALVKSANNLASHILGSHNTVINRLSITVNLIKASLPLRDVRATSVYSIKSSLLTYQPETTFRVVVSSSR